MRHLLTLAAFCLLLITAGPAAAAPPLSAQDKADIARVEAYLNNLKTLQARFLQISSNGAFAEGRLFIDRPGRMRMDYDPPMPVEIVATGHDLVYHDKKLEQVTYLGLDSTPAGLLIGDNIRLSGKVTVTDIERDSGVIRITLAKTGDPMEGSLTLVLNDKPLVLRKWSVVDAQGLLTSVALQGARFGIKLSEKLFEFTDPYINRPSQD